MIFFFSWIIMNWKKYPQNSFFFDIVWILYLSLYCTDEVLFYYYFFLYRLMKPHNSFYGFYLICSKLHTDSSMRNCPIFSISKFRPFHCLLQFFYSSWRFLCVCCFFLFSFCISLLHFSLLFKSGFEIDYYYKYHHFQYKLVTLHLNRSIRVFIHNLFWSWMVFWCNDFE